MNIFPFNKKTEYFTVDERQLMVEAVQEAEKHTSGEVRVFVEGHCSFVDPIDRAREIFFSLKMDATKDRNAVLFYIALKDHQLALFADEGIYTRLGAAFWEDEVKTIIDDFRNREIVGGICHCILDIGKALKEQFPYETTDRNELPDEIIFGK